MNIKKKICRFFLNLFDYKDLNESNSTKDANELLICVSENKIISSNNDKQNIISFKGIILNKTKNDDILNLIIKSIFNKINNTDIKIINIKEKNQVLILKKII